MPRFQPFLGVRYDRARVRLDNVVAPPYDVIDAALRTDLAARDPHNAVIVDLPDEAEGNGRYGAAGERYRAWQEEGVLVTDPAPSFTVYRMTATGDDGVEIRTTGVIGALDLSPPGTDILPHEHTTPKAKTDRLDLLRSCRANLSAIWGLSLRTGLTALLPVEDTPWADIVDEEGVRHTIWVVDDPKACAAIAAAVAEQPIVVADGHHRYETSLAYQGERIAADGVAGAAAATMAYVVELVDDELTVQAIHRLITGLPADIDLPRALATWFEPLGPPPSDQPITATMVDTGCLTLVQADGEVLLRPRPEALRESRDLDSSRLDVALAALPAHTVTYQHGVAQVRAAVSDGTAQAGVLLRPATVRQIENTAHGGERMPPKTTFFAPKPKTGLVFRSLG